MLLLSVGGELFTWGDTSFGKLGHSHGNKPRQVMALNEMTVIGIAAGSNHTAALVNRGEKKS